MSEWQSIETAPNDGSEHIRGLWVTIKRSGAEDEIQWRSYAGFIHDESGRFLDVDYGEDFGWEADDFSHWMPLPEPPK